MRVSHDLRVLQRVGIHRLLHLRVIAVECSLSTSGLFRELAVTYTVIELANLWASFCRSVFLSTALRAKDSTGARVMLRPGPQPRTLDDALTIAIRRLRPDLDDRAAPWEPRHEPDWVNPHNLRHALVAIGASNLARVSSGLRVCGHSPQDVQLFRNFFAHRGKRSAGRVRPVLAGYLIPPTTRPAVAVLRPATHLGAARPQPLLLDWIDDIRNAVGLMI
jgi:hypothetical protein